MNIDATRITAGLPPNDAADNADGVTDLDARIRAKAASSSLMNATFLQAMMLGDESFGLEQEW